MEHVLRFCLFAFHWTSNQAELHPFVTYHSHVLIVVWQYWNPRSCEAHCVTNSIIMKRCGAAEMSWPANLILQMQKDVFVWFRLQPNVTSSWFNYSRLRWKRKLSHIKRNVICFYHIVLHRYLQDFTRKQNPPNWEALCCQIAPTARRILAT